MVDFVRPALELLHHRQKVILDGAADASIWQVVNFGSMLLPSRAQQSAVDRDFPELVDEYCQTTIWNLFQ